MTRCKYCEGKLTKPHEVELEAHVVCNAVANARTIQERISANIKKASTHV